MSWQTIKDLREILGVTQCVKLVAVFSNRAKSPISGFQVDTCSSSSFGGSLASSMQHLSSDNECLPPKEKTHRGKKSAQSKENLVDLLNALREKAPL